MSKIATLSIIALLSIFCFIACQKEVSVENGKIIQTAAEGSLKDTAGNCFTSVVQGTYYNGIPTGDTNFVKVVVNFTTTGTYSISTGIVNGFGFADTGVIGNPGIDTIYLRATGTPALAIPTDFVMTFDSSVCGFTVNVADSTGTGLGNGGGDNGGGGEDVNNSDTAWLFSEGLSNYNGYFDTVFTQDTTIGGFTFTILGMGGATTTGDTAFALALLLPSGAILPGDYSTTNSQAFFGFYDDQGNLIYEASAGEGDLTITIETYDESTGIVTGSFSGTAVDSQGNNVTIDNARFTAKIT